MKIDKIEGNKFRLARKRLRWDGQKVSQRMIAEKLGCSTETINLIENDHVKVGATKWAYAFLLGLLKH